MENDNGMIGNADLEPIKDVKIAPAHGVAALALNFALKYHDITTVQDGTLYQQYKLEGKNFRELHLDVVFETAMRIEMHLMASSERIAGLLIDAITSAPMDDDDPTLAQPPAEGDVK